MDDTTITKKLSKDETALPFYFQLKEDLKQRIAKQEFSVGSCIPTEHQLMAEYGVSRITVARAVSELAKEGLLRRRPGKGTFVAKPPGKLTSKEIVGLIMPTTGHLYGPLASGIIRGLAEHDYFCLVVDPSSVTDQRQSREKTKALIDKTPGILVIEGSYWFPFELLEDYRGRIIFVDTFESEKDYPSSRILSDYREGARMVAEYFLQTGYQKILYWAHTVTPAHKTQLVVIDGARQAFRDHHLPEANFMIEAGLSEKTVFDPELDERLDAALTRFEKPLAVFCHGDSRAKRIYGAARRLDLRIPEDIAVMGYYNTPWCEVFSPTLSSVSIREEEMAEQVVETILTGSDRRILMKPKLILRASTVNR